MKSMVILTTFLLLTIKDLANSHGVDYVYPLYDKVNVSVYNRATDPVVLQGYSYPSSLTIRSYYQKRCGLEIYTVTPTDAQCILSPPRSPQLVPSSNCTLVYYEDTCTTGLIQLVERVKRNGGEVMIYHTRNITEDLRILSSTADVSIPVILVKDPQYVIRHSYQYEYFQYINVTQTSLPPTGPPKQDSGFDNEQRTTIVGLVFAALLLAGILVLSLAIFVCYKRHRRGTRQMVRN